MTASPFADVRAELRRIALDCGLVEVVRWKQPCFQADGHNIVLMGDRSDHCALLFFRGALLDDPEGLLHLPGPNSRVGRVAHVESVAAARALEPALRRFIGQSVEAARAGLQVPPRQGDLELCDAIEEALSADADLRAAWDALTPGRQRGYQIHVSGAKQAATRVARFERCQERILAGKGLRDCICGKSRRLPRCDGSHARR